MAIIECVPNVSEGRRLDIVEEIAHQIRSVPGVRLLDFSADAAHHRSVFTMVGGEDALAAAVMALFDAALHAIDLGVHRGEHPRIGAVDVVPFVPLGTASMQNCVDLARRVGAAVAEQFSLPVYMYEEAALDPARRRLEMIRRGGFEQLPSRMRLPGGKPDFGPATPHPTGGATAIGARMPLIAYNLNLDTTRLDVARTIARTIRESSGGMPYVKAIAVRREDGTAQVSVNATNFRVTPLTAIYSAVERQAAILGAAIVESEIIGLVPAAALPEDPVARLRLTRFTPAQILENRL